MRLRLFSLIWKINAVLILIIGITILAVILIFSWGLFQNYPISHAEKPIKLSDLSEERFIQENWRLNFEKNVNNIAIISLNAERKISRSEKASLINLSSSNYSSQKSQIRNLLFFDTNKQTQHWLFPSNDERNINFTLINPTENNNSILGISYIIEVSHDDPATLNLNEKSTQIVFSDSEGHNLTILAQNIDRYIGDMTNAQGIHSVFFIEEGIPQALSFDTKTRKIIDKKPLN